MRRKGFTALVALSLLGCQMQGQHQEVGAGLSGDGLQTVTTVEGIQQFALDNGMKVLLFPDQSQAKLTVNMTYFVGSRHEGYGEAGMAHLLEHMLFKGTPDRPNIWQLLQERGASFNGTTWTDRTNYYETLPASDENLEFALALEADRMLNSKILAEDLQKEFSVVRNEFEMGENSPVRVLMQRMHSAAYDWHNYGKSTIGNRSDIERVPVENLRLFYEKYYQPDNAMLVVSGRFDQDKAKALIEKHFASMAVPSRKLPQTYTREPIQDGERQVILRRTGDVKLAGVLYHIVPGSHEDFVPVQALSHLLFTKPNGLLYDKLVKSGLASEVFGTAFSWAEPGTFWAIAQVNQGQSIDKVSQTLVSVIESLDPKAITQEQVDRFRNEALRDFNLAIADSQQVGISLSEWAALGDWRLMFIYRDRLESLTVDQVRSAAQKYFVQSNRTVGKFIPSTEPARAPLVQQPDVKSLVADYKGKEAVQEGEVFEASYENIKERLQVKTLAGGAELAMLPKRTRGATVDLQISVRYGNEKDLQSFNLAEYLLPQLMLRGTKSMDYQAVKDKMVALDAQISAAQGETGEAIFRVKTRREKLPEVINFLAEILKEPRLSGQEFNLIKQSTMAGLQQALKEPRVLASIALQKSLNPFPKNSIHYVPSLEESIALLKSTSLEQLKSLYANYWGSNDALIAVVGDFDQAGLPAQIETALSSWQSKSPYQAIVKPFKPAKTASLIIDTPDKKGALVTVGHNLEMNVNDPDYPAVRLASFVFGGSPSSRLYNRLRQKEGLAYGAWGGMSPADRGQMGSFTASSICAPQNAPKALSLLVEETNKLANDGLAADELETAKAALMEYEKNRLADDSALVSLLVSSLEFDRTMDYYLQLQGKVQALSLDDVNAAVSKALKPAGLSQIMAADRKAMSASSH